MYLPNDLIVKFSYCSTLRVLSANSIIPSFFAGADIRHLYIGSLSMLFVHLIFSIETKSTLRVVILMVVRALEDVELWYS